MPKENYSIKLEKDTKNSLRNKDPNIVRDVLDALTSDYDKYRSNTDLLFNELEVARVDNEIKCFKENIVKLQQYKKELLEDLKELQQVQQKENKALNEVWDHLCILVNLEESSNKTYDYTDVYGVFQSSLMSDEDITMFCKERLHQLINPLEEIQNRSELQNKTLKQWQYLLKQIERIEETTYINGVELKQIEKETQKTKKAGSDVDDK